MKQVKVLKHSCLDECPSGPNVGVADEDFDEDGDELMKVVNGIKTEEDAAALLRRIGVEPRTEGFRVA